MLEPKATALLLNALVALKLLNKQGESFSLSEAAARYLRKRSPQYLGGMIRFEVFAVECLGKVAGGDPFRPTGSPGEHVSR